MFHFLFTLIFLQNVFLVLPCYNAIERKPLFLQAFKINLAPGPEGE
jgi:hypothetical protein